MNKQTIAMNKSIKKLVKSIARLKRLREETDGKLIIGKEKLTKIENIYSTQCNANRFLETNIPIEVWTRLQMFKDDADLIGGELHSETLEESISVLCEEISCERCAVWVREPHAWTILG
eukprot:421666_1